MRLFKASRVYPEQELLDLLVNKLIIGTKSGDVAWQTTISLSGREVYVYKATGDGQVAVGEETVTVSGSGKHKSFQHDRHGELRAAVVTYQEERATALIERIIADLDALDES